jgi:hypothetical protein
MPESRMADSTPMVAELFAVLDGRPARVCGGTTDLAAYACEHGTPVRVIRPAGPAT